MRSVLLGGSSVRCSALGFGCVKLTTQETRAAALRTLECALDHGITHFDVARLYGFGQVEGILGEFLRGKRDRVTVTTKFGLRPPESIAKHRRLISIARQVLRRVPAIERRIKRRLAPSVQSGIYTPEEAESSLQISLRELGTDYVDVFLLHEGTPADCQGELMGYLEEQVQRGRIRAYGLGSAASKLGSDLSLLPAGVGVAQFDSSALAPHVTQMRHAQGRGLITFGVMSPLRGLLDDARLHPGEIRKICDQAGLDLGDAEVFAGLLIDDAVRANPTGVTLVATVSEKHVAANVRAAGGDSFTEQQRQAFAELLRRVAPAASTQ
jgi:aryl-alcohol dehydrogenase-like predicted oxidoreductase